MELNRKTCWLILFLFCTTSVLATTTSDIRSGKVKEFSLACKSGQYPIPASGQQDDTSIVSLQLPTAVPGVYFVKHKYEDSERWPLRSSSLSILPRTFRSARIHYLRNLVVLIISNQAP